MFYALCRVKCVFPKVYMTKKKISIFFCLFVVFIQLICLSYAPTMWIQQKISTKMEKKYGDLLCEIRFPFAVYRLFKLLLSSNNRFLSSSVISQSATLNEKNMLFIKREAYQKPFMSNNNEVD